MHTRQLQLSLPDDHLMQLSQSLLALVSLELRPKLEVVIKHGKGLLVVLGQSDFLPQLFGEVSALNSFHVKVTVAFMFENRRVPAVCKGARMPRTQPSQIVLIAAECLLDSPVDLRVIRNEMILTSV